MAMAVIGTTKCQGRVKVEGSVIWQRIQLNFKQDVKMVRTRD